MVKGKIYTIQAFSKPCILQLSTYTIAAIVIYIHTANIGLHDCSQFRLQPMQLTYIITASHIIIITASHIIIITASHIIIITASHIIIITASCIHSSSYSLTKTAES